MKQDSIKSLETLPIHGLAYTAKKFHIIERIFWLLALSCSIVCTFTLIIQLGIKMKSFPIVAYQSDTSVSVSEIHFPAITICPEFLPYLPIKTLFTPLYKYNRYEKHTSKRFYYEDAEFFEETSDEIKLGLMYEEILDKINKGEILIEDLGYKSLNRLQVVDIIMGHGVLAKINKTLPKFDFLEVLNEFDKELITDCSNICFLFHRQCNRYITEVLTPLGLCHSFNIAQAHDLLDINETSNDFHYELFPTCYAIYNEIYDPQDAPGNDTTSPTGLQFRWFDALNNFMVRKNLAGHYIYFHDPYELPSIYSKKFMANVNHNIFIDIVPQINQIDDSLVGYDPVVRNCYLETERTLKFFKKYSKTNCIQECLTDFMINQCECVEFFMIRNSTTRICSATEKNCTQNAKNNFEDQQSSCRCLQPCNYVKYDFALVEKGVRRREKSVSFLTFDMKFEKSRYNPMVWKKQFNELDFFSYFGGLLGLFAGISVLSIVETIYCATSQFFRCSMKRNITRVTPFRANLSNKRATRQITVGIKKYLEESSIHGLRLMLNNEIVQRSAWVLVITTFGIGCVFMISETRYRVPDSRIVAYDDALKSFGYIDFPSVSFFPATIHNSSAYHYKEKIGKTMHELQKQGHKISDEMLKSYAVALRQTCHDTNVLFIDGTSYNVAQYLKHILNMSSRRDWFREQEFLINGKFQAVFAEIPTYFDMGYSFNMLDADELFNLDTNIPFSEYFKNVTPINGNSSNFIKNLKITKEANVVFSMKIKQQIENPRTCSGNLLWIHSNHQIPRLKNYLNFLRVEFGVDLDIEVVPEIIQTDHNLRQLSPTERECYFDGEKKLKYFKKYSMENCIMDCLSTYLISQCGCVERFTEPATADDYCYFIPYNQSQITCCSKYEIIFHELDIPSSPACSCLPTCDSVTYHIKYFHKFSTQSDEISINLRVNTEDAILFRRYQQFTFSDVVSYVGGLLGLFAGISMLSIVEIFYFFVIRVAVDVWRMVRMRRGD